MKNLLPAVLLFVSNTVAAQLQHIEKSLTGIQVNFACNFFDTLFLKNACK